MTQSKSLQDFKSQIFTGFQHFRSTHGHNSKSKMVMLLLTHHIASFMGPRTKGKKQEKHAVRGTEIENIFFASEISLWICHGVFYLSFRAVLLQVQDAHVPGMKGGTAPEPGMQVPTVMLHQLLTGAHVPDR